MISESLFFLLNFDKQFSRQMQIIEYFSSTGTTASIGELAKVIGCSSPTIRNDIVALNNKFPKNIKIKSLGKDGYSLVFPDGVSILSIVMDISKGTDVFNIIDSLFNKQQYTFNGMVSELSINPCTLRNILTHINTVIKQFNISISLSPVKFIGTETDIRIFFFKFYYDFNDYYTLDAEFEKNYASYKSIIKESKPVESPKLHISHFRTTLWIMIIRKRIYAKCYVSIEENFRERIILSEDFHTFKDSFSNAFATLFFVNTVPVDDIIWAYVALLHCVSYSDPSRNLFDNERNEYNLHRAVDSEIINRVNHFLELEFDSSLVESPYLDPMRAYLINLSLLTHLSPQFQSLSVTTRMFVTEALNEYYMKWMKNLYTKEAQSLLAIVHRSDIALALAMLYYSVLSNLKEHDITVLFAFQGGYGYDNYLVQQTERMIPQNIVPFYLFDQIITEEILEQTKAELVVVNYNSPEFYDLSRKVIHLSYIPTMTEWTNLANNILSLSAKKKLTDL